MNWIQRALIALSLSLLPGCAAKTPPGLPAIETVDEAGEDTHYFEAILPAKDGYVLGTSDHLEVNFLFERQLSSRVRVRPDGAVSLPIVDDVLVSGLTVAELETMRDSSMAIQSAATVEYWHALEAYMEEYPESRAEFGDLLFGIGNTGKSLQGQYGALQDKERLKRERAVEKEIMKRAAENPELEELLYAFEEIEIACEELTGDW